jgi:predicted HTH domain antitoxin
MAVQRSVGKAKPALCEIKGKIIMQQTLQLKLPTFVNIDMGELRFILAARLYENGKLSLGQAATLAGVSKRTLMELLGNYGVSIFNYDTSEIERDFKNA